MENCVVFFYLMSFAICPRVSCHSPHEPSPRHQTEYLNSIFKENKIRRPSIVLSSNILYAVFDPHKCVCVYGVLTVFSVSCYTLVKYAFFFYHACYPMFTNITILKRPLICLFITHFDMQSLDSNNFMSNTDKITQIVVYT